MTRADDILKHYSSDNPGTIANLYRLLHQGQLGGTGYLIILPVDQGFEHGPARAFAPNPAGYDPSYHPQLAIDAGLNGYAAPLGFIEAVAREYAGMIPLILKVNNHDVLQSEINPAGAVTSTVYDALRLGCAAVGFTIYPGTSYRRELYEQIQMIAGEAKENGLVVIIWSYPRGEDLSAEGETGIDVISYAAQIACQLGAHIVKVKLPHEHIEQDDARKVYEAEKIPIATLTDRIKHVVQSAFNGKRIVIFSGGSKSSTEEILEQAVAIRDGGGNGSIIGRNSFQRPGDEALSLLQSMIDVYKGG